MTLLIVLKGMLFAQTDKPKLEEVLIHLISIKGSDGPTLFTKTSHLLPVSKETFYRALRSLLKGEVLSKHNKVYELNRHWLQRLNRFAQQNITNGYSTDTDHILNFEDGDKITYSFKNPNQMGIYWAHTYDIIFEKHNPNLPILIHHPHEWLIYSRPKAESLFLDRFEYDKKTVFFSLTGTTDIDRKFKRDYSSRFRQIALGINHGLKNTEYINVLGDFIFKITTSKRFAEDIESFYIKYKEITPTNLIELQAICSRRDKVRMTFIRSKREADKFRAKYKKYFIPIK